MRILKLVLDIKQPDTGRSGKQHDRQVDQQERNPSDRPYEECREGDDHGICCHRRNPWQRAGLHHAERQSLLEEEEPSRADTEHDEWMPVKAIAEPSPARQGGVFRDGERRDIADAPFIQIAGRGVVFRVGAAPVVVGCQRQHADDPACPVVQAAAAEKGAVAAIVLQHEEAEKKPGCR